MKSVTPEEAIAHPNWNMGAKISVDSATMMNKALELIEARWLFDMPAEKLSAIIHPQSIVHAMVEYRDGSLLAQLAEPDMRSPIVYAMQPEFRLESGIPWLDLAKIGSLTFQAVDHERFPAMRLVQDVMKGEDSLAITLNAANEVANQAFRDRRIGFMQIVQVVESVLAQVENLPVETLDEVWSYDRDARRLAESLQPESRLESGIPWLDLAKTGSLTFQAVDHERFPAMRLVQDVMKGEDSLAITLNAANEVANQAFRDRRIGFMQIVQVVESVLAQVENLPVETLDEVWSYDRDARRLAEEVITTC